MGHHALKIEGLLLQTRRLNQVEMTVFLTISQKPPIRRKCKVGDTGSISSISRRREKRAVLAQNKVDEVETSDAGFVRNVREPARVPKGKVVPRFTGVTRRVHDTQNEGGGLERGAG